MLSKLRHAGAAMHAASRNRDALALGLKTYFGDNLTQLQPVAEGSLSLCFTGTLHGCARFFKTHLLPTGRDTLKREAACLRATALDSVDPYLLHLAGEDPQRLWLNTKALQPCPPLTPPAVRDLISRYTVDLRKHAAQWRNTVSAHEDIHLLTSRAETAAACMAEQHLMCAFVQDRVHASIERVRVLCENQPRQLCHGDLGPANIMADGNTAVAVDWEDAFWGLAGYDYLYWLTFFHNRQYLSPTALAPVPLAHRDAVALMVVIVLLKSWLSRRNGRHVHNTLTVDQRLQEIIQLD